MAITVRQIKQQLAEIRLEDVSLPRRSEAHAAPGAALQAERLARLTAELSAAGGRPPQEFNEAEISRLTPPQLEQFEEWVRLEFHQLADRCEAALVDGVQRDLIGGALIKEACMGEARPVDDDCSLAWAAACRCLGVPLTHLGKTMSRPIPPDVMLQLDGRTVEPVLEVDWNGVPHIVVDLNTSQAPLYLGEAIEGDRIITVSLAPSAAFDFE